MNNYTPSDISRRITLIFFLIISGTLIVSQTIFFTHTYWWQSAIIAIVLSFCCYFVVLFYVKKYIDKKVKVIYKIIHDFKVKKNEKPQISSHEDIFATVNKEVIDWAEKNTQEIQKLKELEKYRKEFLGNLAHELKTPVFSVQGYILTLLEGGLEDESINEKFLMKASKGMERITSILEDLDTITKIESDKLELELSEQNIVGLVLDVFDELEEAAKLKNIQLKLNKEYEKPIFVSIDKSKILQVLSNLIKNSISYGNKNGVTIVKFFDVDENILVEITDNGPGIEKEHLPRLFERFYRVDKSRDRHKGGTGIGLAIVKHIIEAHGQSINVRSTVDVGTTFSFTLKKS